MSRIITDQIGVIAEVLLKADKAAEAKNYTKAIQALNEAGVMILAVAVQIQKLTAGE